MYGNNESKLSIRLEAVRLATTLKDVTAENVLEVSGKIADFIVGEANIPETDDKKDFWERTMEKMLEAQRAASGGANKPTDVPLVGNASALGIAEEQKHA